MTHLLTLDTEQASILKEVSDMAVSILGARVVRRDPNRVISDSLKLQQIKIQHVIDQLALPSVPSWTETDENLKKAIVKWSRMLASGGDTAHMERCYTQLINVIVRARDAQAQSLAAKRIEAEAAAEQSRPADKENEAEA